MLEQETNVTCYFFSRAVTSGSIGNTLVCGAGGLRLKSQASQIGHSIANISLKRAVLPGHNDIVMSPANSLHASV